MLVYDSAMVIIRSNSDRIRQNPLSLDLSVLMNIQIGSLLRVPCGISALCKNCKFRGQSCVVGRVNKNLIRRFYLQKKTQFMYSMQVISERANNNVNQSNY